MQSLLKPPKSILPTTASNWFRSLGDPFDELDELQNRMSSFLSRRSNNRPFDQSLALDWSPAVDVIEEDGCFKIQAELPDIKKEDVQVTLDNGVLTISGERKKEKEEKGRRYHRKERSWGSYSRSFQLPDGIDSDKVDAQFKEGVLTLTVPKPENYPKQHRTIEIQG